MNHVIRKSKPAPKFAMPFNHRVIGDKILITNSLGDHAFLTADEFQAFIEGTVDPQSPLFPHLASRNFIASEVDVATQITRYRRRKSFLFSGPTLHAMVLTDRCNHGCQYCHSSAVGMGRTDTDMAIASAERAVEMALQTTSPSLTIEFQGGEPMANWPVLHHVVRHARERNREIGKSLYFTLVTTFSLMDEEKLNFLVDNRVQICTSLDGPEDLHNSIRIYKEGNSHRIVSHWLARVNERYAQLGLDQTLYRAEALPTITRASLTRHRDIVDTFVQLGCRAIFLRKLDPFGFAEATRSKLGYSMDEFIEFYLKALDYIIELNKNGVEVMERNAAIMLTKILCDEDPNYLDLRSPGGAAIGQMAYHPDGSIYTSDEGRMVAAMGDDIFKIGHTNTHSYREIMQGDTVRAMVYAATNESHPDCAACTYQAYCGQQPEYNYKTQGSLHGRMRDSDWCRKHMGIFDHLMARLERADSQELDIFRRWTTRRPQEHFLQWSDGAGQGSLTREADDGHHSA